VGSVRLSVYDGSRHTGDVGISSPREALKALVEKARSPDYGTGVSEASIFEQLIVPLLRDVLGWNTESRSEFDRQTYARGAGFADGVLSLDGHPAVYIEAKRFGRIPAVAELRGRASFYSTDEEQALRYARRSAGMRDGERWTLLTNFNRLRVFEATREERVLAFETPEELLDRFDELMLLSREGVRGGQLRRHLELQRRPDIDTDFREAVLSWRLSLSRHLYNLNRQRFAPGGSLTLKDLQASVQRLLDRLIIIQFAADIDALADEDPLRDLLSRTAPSRFSGSLVEPPSLREALFSAFRRFDQFYNTTLFAPGHVLEDLEIGDAELRELLESLAGQSFRRLDVDILGATYETYLGHDLAIDDGQVVMETRRETRKTGGIFYTPRSVVRLIVDRALRERLSRITRPEEIDAIKVVDPACGSGSFLIEAFNAFADWYEAENRRRQAASESAGTLDELPPPPILDYPRRILESNLYGVDLDPEAVELAAVNLILQAMRRQGGRLKRLPMVLGQNVKAGNSLVPGYFRDRRPPPEAAEALALAVSARRRLRMAYDPSSETLALTEAQETCAAAAAWGHSPHDVPIAAGTGFVWEAEFPEVFDPALPSSSQGFAVVLGNPPWIGFQGDVRDREYLERAYSTGSGRFDVYVPFMELASEVAQDGGSIGMITPSNYFLRDYGTALRKRLAEHETIEEIIDFGSEQLFRGATNYPAITIWRRAPSPAEHALRFWRSDEAGESQPFIQANLRSDGWQFWTSDEAELLEHLTQLDFVESLGAVCQLDSGGSLLAEGVVTGQNEVYLLPREKAASLRLEQDLLRPCVKGSDVRRWSLPPSAKVLIYPYHSDAPLSEEELRTRPNIYGWLSSRRQVPSREGGLAGRAYFDSSNKRWYELWNQRTAGLLDVRKLITSEVAAEPRFAIAPAETAFTDSVTSATPSPASGICVEYLAGILNSRLMALLHARFSVPKANGYLIYRPAFLERLPIARLDLAKPDHRRLHDEIVQAVTAAIEASRALDTVDADFARRISDFTVTGRTLAAELNRYGPDARQNLNPHGGTLQTMRVRREVGALLIWGTARVAGENVARDVDLLRVSVPEPVASFIELYLPVATQFSGQRNPRRTLSARVSEVLLPDMSVAEMGAAVAGQREQLELVARLAAEIRNAEEAVNLAVGKAYALTDRMMAAVMDYVPPARRTAVDVGDEVAPS
jgi:N-6 DNA Methylase/Eco57I restriction-modification methylase/TaqI-like C-terminal specificity domain